MSCRTLSAAVALLAAAGLAVAADPIKLDLMSFKLKPKFAGVPEELVKYDEMAMKICFYVDGTATADVKVAEDGEYTITVEASCDEGNGQKAKMMLKVGDVEVAKSFELKETEAKEYPFTAKLKKGEQKLVIEFLNDEYKENEYDRNLYVHAVKLEKKK